MRILNFFVFRCDSIGSVELLFKETYGNTDHEDVAHTATSSISNNGRLSGCMDVFHNKLFFRADGNNIYMCITDNEIRLDQANAFLDYAMNEYSTKTGKLLIVAIRDGMDFYQKSSSTKEREIIQKIEEVKENMLENVELMVMREGKISDLQEDSDYMENDAFEFSHESNRKNREIKVKNIKLRVGIAAVLVAATITFVLFFIGIILIISAVASCQGVKCLTSG